MAKITENVIRISFFILSCSGFKANCKFSGYTVAAQPLIYTELPVQFLRFQYLTDNILCPECPNSIQCE